jgi:hypothetical protein
MVAGFWGQVRSAFGAAAWAVRPNDRTRLEVVWTWAFTLWMPARMSLSAPGPPSHSRVFSLPTLPRWPVALTAADDCSFPIARQLYFSPPQIADLRCVEDGGRFPGRPNRTRHAMFFR